MTEHFTCHRWEAPIGEAAELLSGLCQAAFEGFEDAYLRARIPNMVDPDLWLAEADGAAVGFKLGYRRGAHLLYSWLGGVVPAWRGRGVARVLMERQHEAARAQGYALVETRTRAANNAMMMLNLSCGFHVCGFEVDARGIPVVTLRKELG